MKILLLLFLSFMIGCGVKEDDTFKYNLDNTNGFKVTYYSITQLSNWIKVNGDAIYKFRDLEGDPTFEITYQNYGDAFGNCVGTITGTMEETSVNDILDLEEDSSEFYDIFKEYRKIVDPFGAVSSNKNVLFKSYYLTVDGSILDSCPFPNPTTKEITLQLYKNGEMILTDWDRSFDFFLKPN